MPCKFKGRKLRNPVVGNPVNDDLEEHAVPCHISFAARAAVQARRGAGTFNFRIRRLRTPDLRPSHVDEGATLTCTMWGQHRERPSANVERATGDPPLVQKLCAKAFTNAGANWTATLEGVLLALVLGESIFAVARVRALAVAALIHEVARDPFLFLFADVLTACHTCPTAHWARGPGDA